MTTAVGLDIGTSAVRAIQASSGRGGQPTVEKLGQVVLPPGAVRDGEIVEADVVAEALRTLWRTYGFKGKRVALGLANQQVVVRQVDLPYLPEEDLRKSLSFQAQDYIPIPIEQALLDLHVVENFEMEDGARISRVLLVAAQQGMVRGLIDVARQAKLEPASVDLDAFALLRALAAEGALGDVAEGELLIDVGASVSNLVVHQGGVPRFVRILLMGGGGITDALVGALGLEYDDAEQAKAEIGLTTDQFRVLEDDRARLITERASRFVDEIRGSVDYYVAQNDSVPVRRVQLVGGAGLLPNLRERLSEVLRIPVEHGHPFAHLRMGRVGLDEEQLAQAEPFFAVAAGLAIGALT